MILTTQIRLLPSADQATLLRNTLFRCNEACSWISKQAVELNTFSQFRLQRLVYLQTRTRFGLSAQAAVRCIAKAARAHKVGKRDQPRKFRKLAAQPYDARLFRFCNDGTVSLWTLTGRVKIPVVLSEGQRRMLATAKGQVNLRLTRAGKWLLLVPYEAPGAEVSTPDDFLGVDLGIVNLAVDSDGQVHSGNEVELVRRRYAHRRRNLQRKGTRAARRKLRKIGSKEARFRRDVNHRISRAIVSKAKRTGRGIALENLKGIRERVTAPRRQRARLHGWSFFQARTFVDYKAAISGVQVVAVDPRYTSQTCPECGHVSKKNRPTRDRFCCECCGHAGPADHVAARNIAFRARAAVNRPNEPRASVAQGSGASVPQLQTSP